jgi:hypothetical protein
MSFYLFEYSRTPRDAFPSPEYLRLKDDCYRQEVNSAFESVNKTRAYVGKIVPYKERHTGYNSLRNSGAGEAGRVDRVGRGGRVNRERQHSVIVGKENCPPKNKNYESLNSWNKENIRNVNRAAPNGFMEKRSVEQIALKYISESKKQPVLNTRNSNFAQNLQSSNSSQNNVRKTQKSSKARHIEIPSRDHPSRDHPSRDHPSRDHPSRVHSTRDHLSRVHSTRDHSSRDHPSRDHPSRDHPSQTHSTRDHPSRVHSSRSLYNNRRKAPDQITTANKKPSYYSLLQKDKTNITSTKPYTRQESK